MPTEDARALTVNVLILAAALLLLYDFAIIWIAGSRASISVVLFEESQKYPVIPAAIFFVLGHIYWTLPILSSR